jgi:penicillin-binding protein 1A
LENFLYGMGASCYFSFCLHGDSWVDAFIWRFNPDSNLATEVISADGVVIGKYFQKQISTKIFRFTKKPCTSTGSYRRWTFYEHSGIDGRGTLRAIASLGSSSGEQVPWRTKLAKQLFHGSKFYQNCTKVKEWIIAFD